MSGSNLVAFCDRLSVVFSVIITKFRSAATMRLFKAFTVQVKSVCYRQNNNVVISCHRLRQLPNLCKGTSSTPVQHVIVDRLDPSFYWTRFTWQQCAWFKNAPKRSTISCCTGVPEVSMRKLGD